jgi:hypothetical protein
MTRKLTEPQAFALEKMQAEPERIYTAFELLVPVSTMHALQRIGYVSGVFGNTASVGRTRGMWWKLKGAGRQVTP